MMSLDVGLIDKVCTRFITVPSKEFFHSLPINYLAKEMNTQPFYSNELSVCEISYLC